MSTAARQHHTVNGASLYAESAGAGSPVVLAHAGIADSRMWDDQWAPFAARHRVVRYDLRGYGRSTCPPAPFSHYDDLRALLDTLQVGPAVVVGASYGGEVALAFALAYAEQVRALVLVNTLAGRTGASDTLRAGWREMEAAFDKGDLDAATEIELRMWVDGPRREPGVVDPAVRERVREMDAALLRRAGEQEAAPETRPDPALVERLEEVAVPTLVIAGALDMPDALESADALARRIPHAIRHDFAQAAHLPSMEQPGAFTRLVLDFIAAWPGQ